MRRVGTVSEERLARRVADFLRSIDIAPQVVSAAGAWELWIRDESAVERGRQELERFVQEPDASRYLEAEKAAALLPQPLPPAARATEKSDQQTARQPVNLAAERWKILRACPATLLLIGLCIGVAAASDFGKPTPAVREALSISNVATDHQSFTDLKEVGQGEVWRLWTPALLHFSPMHLVMNMYWLFVLGAMIESSRGAWRFAVFVIAAGVVSNLSQFLADGPNFGGMSGVVFGLFGFVWIRSRVVHDPQLHIDSHTVLWMMAWMVLCYSGQMGPIANTAHLSGMLFGAAVGALPKMYHQ